MENYNFITLGIDCQPALALKELNLRKYALPFDWLNSTVNMIIECIKDDFKFFHQELNLGTDNILYDKYGLKYMHEYPLKNEDEYAVVDNWMDYKADVITKYERRIKRFKDILNSDTPIIAIYKGRMEDIQQFKDFFKEKYNKTNIVYIIYKYYLKYFNMVNNKIVFDDIIINGDDIVICNAETGIDNLSRAINMVKERKEAKEILERNQLNRKINQSKSNRLLFTSF